MVFDATEEIVAGLELVGRSERCAARNEETNLLALNAAIEASHAGENRKGFAIVASEIKDLTHQSKQATIQVREVLGEIQNATSAAVLSTESVTLGMSELTQSLTSGISELTKVSATASRFPPWPVKLQRMYPP
jgi:methyl-accepting chemotaxis protein